MNALAKEEVGNFVNKFFVSSFQKVGTFKIKNGQKQGGNVAAYFCVPDGRVLHAIAGPVDAKTFLEEATWAIKAAKTALAEGKGNGTRFKQLMRKYHAERLEEETGAKVTPVFQDQTMQNLATALASRDAEGRHLAPVLSLPLIENPTEVRKHLSNTARVHQLLAAHAMMKIENLYGAIFEGILGEKVTTKPVQADNPFPGRR